MKNNPGEEQFVGKDVVSVFNKEYKNWMLKQMGIGEKQKTEEKSVGQMLGLSAEQIRDIEGFVSSGHVNNASVHADYTAAWIDEIYEKYLGTCLDDRELKYGLCYLGTLAKTTQETMDKDLRKRINYEHVGMNNGSNVFCDQQDT